MSSKKPRYARYQPSSASGSGPHQPNPGRRCNGCIPRIRAIGNSSRAGARECLMTNVYLRGLLQQPKTEKNEMKPTDGEAAPRITPAKRTRVSRSRLSSVGLPRHRWAFPFELANPALRWIALFATYPREIIGLRAVAGNLRAPTSGFSVRELNVCTAQEPSAP